MTDRDTMFESDPSDEGSLPTRMRAIVQDRFGPPSVLGLGTVDVPQAKPGQVLIRVVGSSLNMYDVHMTSGLPLLARTFAGWARPKYPVPGADIAGRVVAIGSDVTGLRPGDGVFGDIGMGAFAEYAVADENTVAPLPDAIGFAEAAAVPLAGLTALQGLRDVGELQAGQRVVINGASGGVGTSAVQIAKALGAEVAAVCSTGKVDMVRALGAETVIDYRRDDFTEQLSGYDMIFDNVGDRPWTQTARVLRAGGIHVTTTGPKHRIAGPVRHFLARKLRATFSDRQFTWFTAQVKRTDLESLAGFLATGALKPVIEATYPLERVADGMRHLAEGHARGKMVVAVS